MSFIELTSEGKKMLKFRTEIPLLDKENDELFLAAKILESIGNDVGLTTTEFYKALKNTDLDEDLHENVFLAAIAIETMLVSPELTDPYVTIH